LLTKYIKWCFWRVAVCLSYILDAQFLKVNPDLSNPRPAIWFILPFILILSFIYDFQVLYYLPLMPIKQLQKIIVDGAGYYVIMNHSDQLIPCRTWIKFPGVLQRTREFTWPPLLWMLLEAILADIRLWGFKPHTCASTVLDVRRELSQCSTSNSTCDAICFQSTACVEWVGEWVHGWMNGLKGVGGVGLMDRWMGERVGGWWDVWVGSVTWKKLTNDSVNPKEYFAKKII
jgi:hypothetical protein